MAVNLPDTLRSVLDLRSMEGLVCRPEVEERLKKIAFFGSASGSAGSGFAKPGPSSGSAVSQNRFLNIGKTASSPDGWRNYKTNHTQQQPSSSSAKAIMQRAFTQQNHSAEDGFEVWTGKKKFRGAGAGTGASAGAGGNSGSACVSTPAPVSENPEPQQHTTDAGETGAWKAARFQSLESKIANESVEERILGKIRSKVNSLGESTYDATKAFISQILDSGQTQFLEEFMQLVFQKAATEPLFCSRYARLLHELGTSFQHLRTEMQSRFRDYTAIFEEAEKTPDVGAKDYKKFVEMQEQKKFRRGYSQFVAELAKMGEVNMNDYRALIETIVKFIQSVASIPDKTLLCEEYVDCLSRMCTASAPLLSKEMWMRDCLKILETTSQLPRSSSPGLSNKARFAIMDLTEFAGRGWKPKTSA